MMKKICAMVLTLAMTLSLTAHAALAADAAVAHKLPGAPIFHRYFVGVVEIHSRTEPAV